MARNLLKHLKTLEIAILRFYKNIISPLLIHVFGGGCRFVPTCSEYAMSAVEKYGPFKGMKMSFIRFLNCNPLSKHPREYPLE